MAQSAGVNNLDETFIKTINPFTMAYFMVTVKESKAGARRRRKLVVTSKTRPEAMITIQDLCRGTGFMPDYSTVGEITSDRYYKVVTSLLGRSIGSPII